MVKTTKSAGRGDKRAKAAGRPVHGLPAKSSWGGKRAGAGRKPKGQVAMMPRDTRPAHAAAHPALVTVKLQPQLPRLRRPRERAALLAHFARGKERFGFRLLHFAILDDQLHFVVEAKDRLALTRGMKGLLVRLARGLNTLWGRKGQVFPDRFHDRPLTSPREVRDALAQVFGNTPTRADGPEAFSSAPWFDGFVASRPASGDEAAPPPVATPRTWLAGVGWRRHGRIPFDDQPRSE